jgi:hypothetical protein
MLGAIAAVLLAVVAGCSESSDDVEAAKKFDAFPLYWVGERFEQWDLTAIDGLDYPSEIISFIYGDCTPRGGEQPSCTPPFQIQVSPTCARRSDGARTPTRGPRRIRGAPVGVIDGAPVLLSRGAQIKVYRGEGSDRGVGIRVLHALRSINDVPPVISSTDRIPAARSEAPDGTASCSG